MALGLFAEALLLGGLDVLVGEIEDGFELGIELGALVGFVSLEIRLLHLLDLGEERFDFGLVAGLGFIGGALFLGAGELDVAELGGGEDAVEAIVIRLQDGIELVVVAAGAADGEAHEGGGDAVGHLHEIFLAVLFFVDVAADDMAGAGAEEAGGDEGVGVLGVEFVAGELFADETVVALVGVEGADQVIAIAPGVGALGVEFKAIGVGVANYIEPLLRPAFAIALAGHEAVEEAFVGFGAFVFQEGGDFVGSGREAGEIKGCAADEGALGDGLRLGWLEEIDGVLAGGDLDFFGRLEGPIVTSFGDEGFFLGIDARGREAQLEAD